MKLGGPPPISTAFLILGGAFFVGSILGVIVGAYVLPPRAPQPALAAVPADPLPAPHIAPVPGINLGGGLQHWHARRTGERSEGPASTAASSQPSSPSVSSAFFPALPGGGENRRNDNGDNSVVGLEADDENRPLLSPVLYE